MTTPRLGAPELAAGQAIPETKVNEQIRYVEQGASLWIVKDKDLATPPGSPADGDAYIVAASPTGAWTGWAGRLAFYVSTAWKSVSVIEGFFAWVQDENLLYYYNGAAWASYATAASGALLAANNLSDVANAATSRTNLGLSTAATLTSDTDGTLAANSDTRVATQKAVKTYVDGAVTGLLDLKGSTDCSANPNYPAASKGDTYIVTVAGKIGGASGKSVDVGDIYVASADNAGGTEASVGTSWFVLEHNLAGAMLAANNLSDLTNAGTARTNLGLGSIATFPEASAAEYRANTADKALSTDGVWAAADYVALTDAATVAVDMSAGFNFSLTIGGNRTLGNPTNTKNGQTGCIVITQDGTGSRTLAYGSNWEFASATAPVLSTAAGAKDLLFYQVISATSIYATLIKAVS